MRGKNFKRGYFIILLTIMLIAAAGLSISQILPKKKRIAERYFKKEMVLIPGGTFWMGMENSNFDESPVHKVELQSFLIDRYEVANRQFAEFVEETGYVTQAERDGYCWCYTEGADDFQAVPGANWRQPEGMGSSIENRMNHPVVCISWDDASAYARWAGKRLPTEAEWEYAARAGSAQHFTVREGHAHSSEASLHSHDEHEQHANDFAYIQANVWQGTWPQQNHLHDGFYYTAPVGQFAPNDWGVYDMIGNVWEWTADWYAADYYQHSPKEKPTGPADGDKRVARGGSWFCSPNYCGAYSTHYRGVSPPSRAFNNVGFRCAADLPAEN